MAAYGVVLPPGGIVYGADASWRGPEVEQRFSFVLKMASLGGVVQRGLIFGYVMFDVHRMVELSGVRVVLVAGLARSLH